MDIKGKCSTKNTIFSTPIKSLRSGVEGEQIFCMNLRGDTATHKYTGETVNGLWGKYISHELSAELSNEWGKSRDSSISPDRRSEIEKLHREKLKLKATLEQQARKTWQNALLPELERDREIRKVLNSLSISDRDYNNLQQRGFTKDQILDYQYKSVQIEQPLQEKVSQLLAGVNANGMNLNLQTSAMLVPIKNHRDKYIGWQYKFNTTKNKYKWAKTEVAERDYNITSHLKDTLELPLAYCVPHSGQVESKYIGLTEGVGFKNQLTANKYNQIVIGAAGGLFASSPKTLAEYLTAASEQINTKNVLIYPDAGAVKNPSVLRSYFRTINFLEQEGYSPVLAWWGQTDKLLHPDIDEIGAQPFATQENSKDLTVIEPNYFFNLGKLYSGYDPKHELNYRQKPVDRLDELANKLIKSVEVAIERQDTTELKSVIELHQNKFEAEKFKSIKKDAWSNLNSSQQLQVKSLLNKAQEQQLRIEKVAPILAKYLQINDNKLTMENSNTLLGFNTESNILLYQNKLEHGECLVAQFEGGQWKDRGSNLSLEKEIKIIKQLAPKIENIKKLSL
ncbi:MAG: hypothetical protein RLZZ574_752 [Cyanobacteriota bacterium]|jgi:hypothetical protein